MIYILVGLFILAFILAFRSMKDFNMPSEIRDILNSKKRGTIIFSKGKVLHYKGKGSSQ